MPSQPRAPKPPGTSTPSTVSRSSAVSSVRHVLRVDPAHPHGAAVVQAGMLERLVHGEVGVLKLHVLADERDLDELAPLLDALRELRPFAEVGLAAG